MSEKEDVLLTALDEAVEAREGTYFRLDYPTERDYAIKQYAEAREAIRRALTSAPRVVVTEEIPKSLRDKWHREKGNGMTSAVGEYTPGEFWMLLDAYEAQLEECAFLQAGAERSMQAHADALRQLTAALAVAPAPTANGGGEVAHG
jgi:hypothetical protein